MNKLFYIAISLTFISFLITAEPAKAVTEFISTIKQSGGDYSTLASWEAAIQSNLAASTTAVYSGTGTGSLSQGNIVELFRAGVYQNATSTVVATTSSQILVQNYYNSGAPITLQSGDEWRKASSTANMFTVSGSGVQLGDTPVATAQIDGAWTSADTTAVTIDGWTTDATRYIRIYTTAAARHNGKWDTGKYRLVVANANLWTYEGNTRIEGLQIHFTSLTASNDAAVATLSDTEVYDIRVSASIIRGPGSGATGTNNQGIFMYVGAAGSKARIWNTLIYDFTGSNGIRFNDADFISYAYNISSIDNGSGYLRNSGTAILKNCLAKGNTSADFNGVMTVDYCVSADATADDNGGIGNKINQTFSFIDSTNKDFHLSSADTSAKDAGTNLSVDANLAFSDDIDGNTRPVGSAWDIGADETYGVIIIIE